MLYNRKRATALTGGRRIAMPLMKADGSGWLAAADWTPADGDVKVDIDYSGTAGNIATLPSPRTIGGKTWWIFTLSASELSSFTTSVSIDNAALESDGFIVETFGDPTSAMTADDQTVASTATPANFAALSISSAGEVLQSQVSADRVWASAARSLTTFGTLIADLWANATRTLSDKTGFSLTAGERTSIRQEIDANSTQLAGLVTLANALSTSINNLNNLSALANLLAPVVMEVPGSGTRVYLCRLTVKDTEGHLVDLDALPTPIAVNAAGTDRSANLSAPVRASVGVYNFTYTLAAGAAEEGVIISATGAVAASARRADAASSIVSVDTANSLAAILTKLGVPTGASLSADIAALAVHAAAIDTRLPNDPASETNATTNKAAVLTRLGNPAGASVSADIAAVEVHAAAIDTRLPAAPGDETLIINATTAIVNAIAALNNLSAAQAQTAVTTAVTAYGAAKTSELPTPSQIADGFLVRNHKGGANGPSTQSVSAALAGGLMNFSISGGVLTVHNGDGTTAYTRNLTRAQLDALIAAA